MTTRLCFLGHERTRGINVPALIVSVVVPHPVRQVVIGPVLIAAFGSQVEVHVGAEHFFVSPSITGIGVEDFPVLPFIKNADAGEVFYRSRGHGVVVEHLAGGQVTRSKRHVIVVVEVVAYDDTQLNRQPMRFL